MKTRNAYMPTDAIIIKVEPDWEELVRDYLQNRHAEILLLDRLAIETKFMEIQDLAHKLKGNAASYGFLFLSEVGAKLEAAAEKQDAENIVDCLKQIRSYLGRVRIEINEEKSA